MQELKGALKDAAKKLFEAEIEPEITRPDEQFGDYATNLALQLAKKAAATPRQIAQQLVDELQNLPGFEMPIIAGPGFINFKLTDEALQKAALAATDLPKPNAGQEILVEFGDPNPFKEMHIGHVYSYIAGDTISSLLKASGAKVKRLSYHGDVGLHVAKAIWGMQKHGAGDIAAAYAAGAKAYEDDAAAKHEIDTINEHLYKRDDPEIDKLYEQGKEASFKHFDEILNMLSISIDKRYYESDSAQKGTEVVKQNIGKVFKESEGAVVYEGEKAGLHTRVFLTSKGLPTYEAKDLGLAELKDQDYPNAQKSIIITAHEQADYFKVMLAALAEINKPLADKTVHLYHGFVSLSTGKMSSRTGDVYTAQSLINEVKQAASEQFPDSAVNNQTAVAALKYDFLKSRLGSDITFDIKESVSLEGNSGPYLQYAHARACSIIEKAKFAGARGVRLYDSQYNETERSLARKISEYPEIVTKACEELLPSHLCTYLYELAQTFNRFYESNRVIGSEREIDRIGLVGEYVAVLRHGLNILNIEAPERM